MSNLFRAAAAVLLVSTASANAATMVENFDNPLANWRSGFMGQNSNLENYYVETGSPIGTRGNNPDGLWIADGISGYQNTHITFNAPFAQSLTSLSFLLSTFVSGVTLQFYDASHAVLNTFNVVQDSRFTPVLSYGVTSTTGIGGFSIFSTGRQVEGNTSIDAITAVTGGGTNAEVPLPASALLLSAGLGGLAMARRKRIA